MLIARGILLQPQEQLFHILYSRSLFNVLVSLQGMNNRRLPPPKQQAGCFLITMSMANEEIVVSNNPRCPIRILPALLGRKCYRILVIIVSYFT